MLIIIYASHVNLHIICSLELKTANQDVNLITQLSIMNALVVSQEVNIISKVNYPAQIQSSIPILSIVILIHMDAALIGVIPVQWEEMKAIKIVIPVFLLIIK